MERRFLFLLDIIDWRSRYVVAWRLSNILDTGFCAEPLEEALGKGQPDMFNAGQNIP